MEEGEPSTITFVFQGLKYVKDPNYFVATFNGMDTRYCNIIAGTNNIPKPSPSTN